MKKSPVSVGLIANPASGKDIRRLVGHATTISNQQKIGILRRTLLGLAVTPVERVLMMPDTHRLAQRAQEALTRERQTLPAMETLSMTVEGTATDSLRAAHMLREAGVGCIIVLGGDGTVRIVSQEAGDIPLVAISTGTNNVLPSTVEGTIAGIAAGGVASGNVVLSHTALRHKWLQVLINGTERDRALVDVGVLRGRFVGSRAVWRAEDLLLVAATQGAPDNIGLSAILGIVQPVHPQDDHALAAWLNGRDERHYLVPIAPGMIATVNVSQVQRLEEGQAITLEAEYSLVCSLDGERELALREGDRLKIILRRDGPWMVNVYKVLTSMQASGYFER